MSDEQLYAMVADARADAAAAVRRRTRWLERQLTEDSTLRTVCGRLVGGPVEVRVPHGRRRRGRLLAVEGDVLVVAATDATSYIALAAVSAIRRADPAVRIDVDDVVARAHAACGTIDEILATMAEQRRSVVLFTHSGHRLAGRVDGVGRDVVRVVHGHADHVRLTDVADITVGA